MVEDRIHNYDSTHIIWTPLTWRRPLTTFRTDKLLCDLTLTLQTLLIVVKALWLSV